MTIHPIDAATAAFLEADASGRPPLVPILPGTHPELARLLMFQIEHGTIPPHEYEQARLVLGKSVRQIQRYLAQLRDRGTTPSEPVRQRFELSLRHKQVIFACQGNVELAYEQLCEAGDELPNYATFWRRWYAQPMAIQAYARRGAQGLVNFYLYPPFQAPDRNVVWQADHFELPVAVIADAHKSTLVKPTLTLMVDDCTRKVMAWALTASPNRTANAETVLATIASGVRIRLEQLDGEEVAVGGIPGILRWDNDTSFTARSVLTFGISLGFECHAVPPYSGNQKGKVERLGRTVQEQFCVLQPGYTHGPKTHSNKDLFRNTDPITADQLRARLSLWFAEYDRRPHSALGMSPLQAWSRCDAPLRRAPDERLRPALLLEPRRHKVNPRKGICFKGDFWMSAGLIDIVGRNVEIRYPVGPEPDFIEVYLEGKWFCTAESVSRLEPARVKAIWERRDDLYQESRGYHAQATELREMANAHMDTTAATPAVASMPVVDQLVANAEDFHALYEPEDPS